MDVHTAIAPVLFDELLVRNGRRIGVATLNAPATLNGLSLAMVDLLQIQLDAWADDPTLCVVLLRGAGDKAFCAGGDLHSLYRSMREQGEQGYADPLANAYARDFFAREYRLDHAIHRYPKPLLCLGDGIVMGGGIGLMAGASHRVVTERSRLAMPEIGIGLYPDVGGSWLLARAPALSGRFLALTGAPLDASDALYAGFADHAIDSGRLAELMAALTSQPWSGRRVIDDALLDGLLRQLAAPLSEGPLQRYRDLITRCCAVAELATAVAAIAAIEQESSWLRKAASAVREGSPGSMRLAWELQQRAARLSLAETFRLEYIVSLHCAAHGDFAEGIRALLIDKDRQPDWSPVDLAAADAAWAERFMRAPWPVHEAHPLADLAEPSTTDEI